MTDLGRVVGDARKKHLEEHPLVVEVEDPGLRMKTRTLAGAIIAKPTEPEVIQIHIDANVTTKRIVINLEDLIAERDRLKQQSDDWELVARQIADELSQIRTQEIRENVDRIRALLGIGLGVVMWEGDNT